MPFGPKKGFSDFIRGVRARAMMDACAYAAEIGRPLNVAVDINWSRTSAGEDEKGLLFASFRKAAGRFLRERGAEGLTCIWARELPPAPVPRPNAHLNLYVPARLFDTFVKHAHTFLPAGCVGLSSEAVYIQAIGGTGGDHIRRNEYLVKGAHPKARLKIKRARSFQGRIIGKRCGTSEDIGPSARLAAAERIEVAIATIPY